MNANHRKFTTVLRTLPLVAGCWIMGPEARASVADSVYLFVYNTPDNNYSNGLHYAWSADMQQWRQIGHEYSFVKSDYGAWGSEKRMFAPSLIHLNDGSWKAVWQVNASANQFATTETPDMLLWKPQDYPTMAGVATCEEPLLSWNAKFNEYEVVFKSGDSYYKTTSVDFFHFTNPVKVDASAYKSNKVVVNLPNRKAEGQVFKLPISEVRRIEDACQSKLYKSSLYAELAKDDATRFADIKDLKARVVVDAEHEKPISDKLIGIFFEDINYAADGGLYAELIQNRDFEYSSADAAGWHATTAWSVQGDGLQTEVRTDAPIHANNPHYVALKSNGQGGSWVNGGFDGIVLRKGEKYDLSLFVRRRSDKGTKLKVALCDGQEVVASSIITVSQSQWKQQRVTLTPQRDVPMGSLALTPMNAGELDVDMVSLFPRNTFKGRKNGLRADLAQTLADLHPKFVRFPGGCVAHGNGVGNIYQWKETIGPLEARKPQFNLWGYHQSKGLGYYEYFQFCEDLGAEPLPVLAAAVPCQNSSCGGAGQQGGVPMSDMPQYIQDVLDLIEWANGDPRTSVWAKKRAEQGHPKPFNLKYIGIGNEDMISSVFAERYLMIIDAVKKRYPDIIVCGTAGPWFEGSDYEYGWQLANKHHIDMVDEHYYQSPGWFIYNQDFYDQYDRKGSKVYLGEYASHVPGRHNNIETALTEALHLCGVERNGDVVAMTSYAPLLAKDHHTQWSPDLIYFNNAEVKPTVGYFVQQLFGRCTGDVYLPSVLSVNEGRVSVRERMAVSTVRDSKTGHMYLKLVNMMPCEVSTNVELKNLSVTEGMVEAQILSGSVDDTQARPRTIQVDIEAPSFQYTMPAYSLTVIPLE